MLGQTPGEWTWMKGSMFYNSPGNFGMQGISNPANDPPAVLLPASWVDLQGNLWIYGGGGITSFYGDLWKYDITSNQWTWIWGTGASLGIAHYGVRGVAAPSNDPGSRAFGIATWTDTLGNLWMFGGQGPMSKFKNDLWKYNIATNLWTWVSGDSINNSLGNYGTQGLPSVNNRPCSRDETTVAWVDQGGNFWLFGGNNQYQSGLNDIWKYNPFTNEWTWMKGSNSLVNVFPNYGVKGISSITNDPGSRVAYSHWVDLSGSLYLFGGARIPGHNSYNDLWKYETSTNEWTWISGDSILDSNGNYNLYCDTSIADRPAGRFANTFYWTDSCGSFWLFGGYNFTNYRYHDLWKYAPHKDRWSLVSGTNSSILAPVHGTQGVSNSTNTPGARFGGVSWTDSNNNFWLFGGQLTAFYNDVWRYIPDYSCSDCNGQPPLADFNSGTINSCSDTCINFFNYSQSALSYAWLFPGGNPSFDTIASPQGICYANPGSYDVTLIAYNNSGSDTLTITNLVNINQPNISPISQIGDSLYTTSGFYHYQWYLNTNPIPLANQYYYVANTNGNYSVEVSDSNGCQTVAYKLGVTVSVMSELHSRPFSVLYFHDKLLVNSTVTNNIKALIEIYDIVGKNKYTFNYNLINGENSIDVPMHLFETGIYILKIKEGTLSYVCKFFID